MNISVEKVSSCEKNKFRKIITIIFKGGKIMDYERLRKDLLDYFGTAMFSGFPMAVIDISKIERATNEELERIALNNGFDLNDYKRRTR